MSESALSWSLLGALRKLKADLSQLRMQRPHDACSPKLLGNDATVSHLDLEVCDVEAILEFAERRPVRCSSPEP